MQIPFHCSFCGTEKIAGQVRSCSAGNNPFRPFAYVICSHCGAPSILMLKLKKHYSGRIGDDLSPQLLIDAKVEGIMPSPPKPMALDYLPDAAGEAWLDAEISLERMRPRATCSSYRTALDLAIKSLFPDIKGTLGKRIDALHGQGNLPSQIQSLAHGIRIIGNESVHDLDDLSIEEAKEMRQFLLLVFTYLIDLPNQIASFEAKRAG